MFKDPIAPKPEKPIKTPWNFEAPCYDQRNRIAAGDDYGVGHRCPVGHLGNPKPSAATLPFGRPDTMQTDDIPRSPLEMYGTRAESKRR